MPEPLVAVRALTKRFGGVVALAGVDLKVDAGEVVALVGRSGSGKTTLARCILGLESPDAGEIHLEGRPWHRMRERERQPLRARYQYLPQDPLLALDPQQTVLEHIVESAAVLGGLPRAEAEAAARSWLVRLGLGARLHALPRMLSGGEQRRVTLARVFVVEPKLLVADEPTSGLDPDRQEHVLRDLMAHLPQGAACLLVTHDVPVARHFCTRAVVMLEGNVLEEVALPHGEPAHVAARQLFELEDAP